MFLTNAEPVLQRLLTGFEAGDFTEVERAAHTLKSSAGSLGAHELAAVAGSIEHRAAEGEASKLRPALVELEGAFGRAKARLIEEKGKGKRCREHTGSGCG